MERPPQHNRGMFVYLTRHLPYYTQRLLLRLCRLRRMIQYNPLRQNPAELVVSPQLGYPVWVSAVDGASGVWIACPDWWESVFPGYQVLIDIC